MAAMSVSCLLEKDGPSAERQSVMIELSVSAGDFTKSASTDAEKLINTLRVYAFYGDVLAGYAERSAVSLNDPFYMDLELPETGIHNVDFYLIANGEEMRYENSVVQLSENMTKSQLEAINFTGLVNNQALPMYCRKTVAIDVDSVTDIPSAESGHRGHFVLSQKVSFNLERSLAKISVYAAKVEGTSNNPQILKIDLLAAGTRHLSYLFPQTDEVIGAVASRANDRNLVADPVTITSSVVKGSAAALDPANYSQVLSGAYLPEVSYGTYVNTSWNASSGYEREAVLYMEYNLGEGQSYKYAYVYLPEIVRNTHYKVCVLINSEGQIIINYVVADWEDHEMSDISFDYPTHSYVLPSVPESGSTLPVNPTSPAEMSEASPFTGYFQMIYPLNDAWTPTLIGLNASDCTVKVYEYPGAIEVTDWPIPASDKWYRITVTPQSGHMAVGDEVQLAVSYQASGLETKEFLLINGTHEHYFWPYAGAVQQDANYVIITMVN